MDVLLVVVFVVVCVFAFVARYYDEQARRKRLAELEALASSADPAERAQAAQGYYELGNKEWNNSRPWSIHISQNDDMNDIRRKEAHEQARQMQAREAAVQYWLQAAKLGHQGAYEQLEMVQTLGRR